MTWVRCAIDAFNEGDRIRFTDEGADVRVEAEVIDVTYGDGEVLTDHLGAWVVNGHDNGQLYRWVDDAPTAEGHWADAAITDFRADDRIQFDRYGVQHEGVVTTLCGLGTNCFYVTTADGTEHHITGIGGPTTILRRWVDGAAPPAETWVPVNFEALVVGDRIRFNDYGDRPAITGTVVCVDYGNTSVARDDGVRGGGVAGGWFINHTSARNLQRLELPGAAGVERPRRAVFCQCCGYATGEFTNTRPTELYCVGCRALPNLLEHGGAPTPGLLNVPDGRAIGDTHARRHRMTNIGAVPGVMQPPPPTLDLYDEEDDDEEDEEEQPGYRCVDCGDTEFQVENVQMRNVEINTNTQDGYDHAEGDTLRFYADFETGDLVTGDAYLVCAGCGTRQADIPFTVAW